MIKHGSIAGLTTLAFLLGIIGAALIALLTAAGTEHIPGSVDHDGLMQAYIPQIISFTISQAALSSLISIPPALLMARAFARQPRFPGRSLLLRLLTLPLAFPPIVAVFGIIEIWGRQGVINQLLALFSDQVTLNIYGLPGILIAHLFFNLPLATRLFLVALDNIPGESWRLSAQLGFGPRAIWRLLEWPALRAQLPAISGLVFMLCLTSFTITLTLGGGPRTTTIEVAIYQALRFDFNPELAVYLSFLQLSLSSVFLFTGICAMRHVNTEAGLDRRVTRLDGRRAAAIRVDAMIIGLASLFIFPIFAALIVNGLQSSLIHLVTDAILWRALGFSVIIATSATILTLLLAWPLSQMSANGHLNNATRLTRALGHGSDLCGNLFLAVSPIVLGAGWFILLPTGTEARMIIVIIVNALTALPFAIRILAPAVTDNHSHHDRLCAALGIFGTTRFRLVDWPVLRRPFGSAAAFSLALSLGDLGVIALFGTENLVTLPHLLLQRLSSYRIDDAASLALLLGFLCLALISLADHGTRRHLETRHLESRHGR